MMNFHAPFPLASVNKVKMPAKYRLELLGMSVRVSSAFFGTFHALIPQ